MILDICIYGIQAAEHAQLIWWIYITMWQIECNLRTKYLSARWLVVTIWEVVNIGTKFVLCWKQAVCYRKGPGCSVHWIVRYFVCRLHSSCHIVIYIHVFSCLYTIYTDIENHLLCVVRCAGAFRYMMVHKFRFVPLILCKVKLVMSLFVVVILSYSYYYEFL